MHAPPFTAALLAPRHWPLWLALGLMRLLNLLPLRLQLALGEALGLLAGAVVASRRRVIAVNLAIAFPEKSAAEQAQLAKEHCKALGRGIFESALAWWASDARIRRLGSVRGAEHLREVQGKGKGALLLTGHFTTLELGGRILAAHGVEFHAMYRPYENPVMNFLMHRWREQRARLPAVPREELRTLVKTLRAGAAVWYAPDQALDSRISVYVPFFGKPVATIVATSKLAAMGRAAVVPYFPAYLGRGRYEVVVQAALEGFPGEDETADAARVNRVLEDGIRAHAPAEYFWVHRRFKQVPPGTPDPYARAS